MQQEKGGAAVTIIDLLKSAGAGLKTQRLDGSFVEMRQKKHDAEVTFVTESRMAAELVRSIETGEKPEYIGLVLWVPASAWDAARKEAQP